MKERIRQIRKENGLTQKEFADKLSLKQSTISAYESGQNKPIDAIITSICKTFHVSEEWLRTGRGEMALPTLGGVLDDFRTRYDLTDDDLAFYRAFAELDAAQRRAVLDFADRIVEVRKQKKPPQSIADAAAEADPESSLERIAERIHDQKKAGEKSSVSNG